ncbi:MAG TPA: MBL fold metallo-hydrolase [Gaiella sp.]|jgi:L-ascorbate metabolism protein UlaG (beta-lactamase superfamily)|nr:MBL fold metallo-hydrolase [Gaiella sp.]
MRIRWLGQSAFLLSGSKTVLIDPFGPETGERLAARGMEFRYPPIDGIAPDLVLVTHEHSDHNGVEVARGTPAVLRSTAGRLESPVGEVLAIASEHDDQAGTARGPNTIFCLTLDGVRLCHLGDLGQPALRPEQRDAVSDVDVLFVPVGGGPTIDGPGAAELVREVAPRVVFPMHYRTEAVGFLEPADAFLDALGAPVERPETSEVELDGVLAARSETVVVLLPPPLA